MMGYGGLYLNWIIGMIVFSLIFWGTYYMLIKSKELKKKK